MESWIGGGAGSWGLAGPGGWLAGWPAGRAALPASWPALAGWPKNGSGNWIYKLDRKTWIDKMDQKKWIGKLDRQIGSTHWINQLDQLKMYQINCVFFFKCIETFISVLFLFILVLAETYKGNTSALHKLIHTSTIDLIEKW